MGDARYTKNGLLIPSSWLKGLGAKVRVQRSANVLFIESQERETSRKLLARMVRSLRRSSTRLGSPRPSEIAKLVNEVRRVRAGRS